MMNFDFGLTAGSSQTNIRPRLEGEGIHDVTFDGCTIRTFQGKSDPTKNFLVLDIKFSNKDGEFTDTVWEPKESDMQDGTSQYGPTPSKAMHTLYKFKHLIDAVNPDLAKKIDDKTQSLNAPNWKALCELMVKATQPGVGKTTKIKLIKDRDGFATFPIFFLAYDSNNRPRMKTNFIGNNIFWTTSELNAQKKRLEAKPTIIEPKEDDLVNGSSAEEQTQVDWTF